MLSVILGVLGVGVVSLGAIYLFHPGLIFVAYIAVARMTAGVTRKEAQVGKVKWVYAERGERKSRVSSLVLVHGFSGNRDGWNWVIKKLSFDIHIIAVDLPGHGDTKEDPDEKMINAYKYFATNLKLFLETIGLGGQPVHLVGASMGGAISGLYAATYPEHVKQITLVCPAMDTPILAKLVADRNAMAPEDRPTLIVNTAEQQQKSMKYVTYKEMKFPKQFYKAMVEMRKKYVPYLTLLVERMEEPQNVGILNKVMNKIRTPSQIVWGEDDHIVHVSGAKVLKEGLPNVKQYDIIPQCGQAVDLEKGPLLAERIQYFRDTTEN